MAVTTRAAARRSNSPLTEPISSAASSRRPSPTKSNGSPSDGEGRIRPTRKQLAKTTITASDATIRTADVTEDHDSNEAMAYSGEKTTNGNRGRGVRRKRSHEDLGEEQENGKVPEVATKHLRKRSKEMRGAGKRDESASEASASDKSEAAHSGDEDATIMTSPSKAEPVTLEEDRPVTPPATIEESTQSVIDGKKSPPGKRNRDQFTQDHATPESKEVEETESSDTATEPTARASRPALAAKALDKAPDSKRHRDSFIGSSVTEEKPETTAKV